MEHCSRVLAFPRGLCCKHIAAACFLLYMTSRVSLLYFSLLFAPSLPRRGKRWSLTSLRGQEEWYLCIPTTLCPLFIFHQFIKGSSVWKHKNTTQFKGHWIYSVSYQPTWRDSRCRTQSGQSVNLVSFRIVSHVATSCTPNSLLCTITSGSVVELFHSSQKYQPWSQSAFVSRPALYRSCFGVDPMPDLSIFFCVCVYVCVYLTACLHAIVSAWICACARWASIFFFFLGFWAVLSVDSAVSFGLGAASSADRSDEMWQTGTVLLRKLPHPILSPCMASIAQGQLREGSHKLVDDSE